MCACTRTRTRTTQAWGRSLRSPRARAHALSGWRSKREWYVGSIRPGCLREARGQCQLVDLDAFGMMMMYAAAVRFNVFCVGTWRAVRLLVSLAGACWTAKAANEQPLHILEAAFEHCRRSCSAVVFTNDQRHHRQPPETPILLPLWDVVRRLTLMSQPMSQPRHR